MTTAPVFPEPVVEAFTVGELQRWVDAWAGRLPEKTVLLLCGEVGAGKTQMIQCLVRALGGDESSSPSYAIHNKYLAGDRTIDHFDLYRLEDDDDLESTGFWDFFAQDEAIIAIEWADRLAEDVFPPQWRVFRVDIAVLADPSRRRITVSESSAAGSAADET